MRRRPITGCIGGRWLDVYVTHLYRSQGDDALRLYQVLYALALAA